MELKRRLFNWFTVMLIGFGALGAITTSYLPASIDGASNAVADSLIFATLYAAIFLVCLGASTLANYGQRWLRKQTILATDHWPIIRQSGLISIGVTATLALQGYSVFTWWDATLLIVALGLVELSFHTKYLPKR